MKKFGSVFTLFVILSLCVMCSLMTVSASAQSTEMNAAQVASALSSGEYKLTSDITVSDNASVVLSAGTYDLYLSGHTLSCYNSTQPLFTVGSGVTLNIYGDEDQTVNGTGTMSGADTLFALQGGTLNLYGVNANADITVFNITGGTLSVRGGNYTANTTVFSVNGTSSSVVYYGNFQATDAISSTAGSFLVLGGTYNGALNSDAANLKIAGGTFSADPSEFKATNTMTMEKADNLYTVDPKNENAIVELSAGNEAVAFSDTIGAAAWNMTAGNTIVLLKDLNIPSDGNVYVNKTLVLDLNGKAISYASRTDFGFKIETNGNMTVIDSNPTTVHKFRNNSGLWTQDDTGDITVYGGILFGKPSASSPIIWFTKANTSVTWTAGNIVGNAATCVMFYNNTSVFNMIGGAIQGNSASALWLTTGSATLTGGTISNIYKTGTDSQLTVGGSVKITGLKLANGATITLGDLKEGAQIGISSQNTSNVIAYDVKESDRLYFTNEYIHTNNNTYKDCIVKYEPATTGDTPVASRLLLEKPLEVTVADLECKYDGTGHLVPTPTVNFSNDVQYTYSTDGKTFSSTVPSVTNAGKTIVTVKATRYGWEEATTTCTLTVTKRSVTMTSTDGSKKFDLTALTSKNVSVTGDGFISGEGATYNVTGTQTDVGSSENTFTYTLNQGTSAGNYEITTVNGTLTVTRISDTPIVIQAGNDTKVYDGTVNATSDYTYTYTGDVLLSGDTLEATFGGANANAGISNMKVMSYKVMRGSIDVTQAYTFGTPELGTMTVTKRSVTMTSTDGSKKFDLTALTSKNVTVTGDGFISGEGAIYNVTGTQTDVGSSENTFTYTLNQETSASNYEITTVNGTLTVTRISDTPIVIQAGNDTKVYDGTVNATSDYTYTYTGDVLLSGDTIEATFGGTSAGVGTSDMKVLSYKVMRGSIDITQAYTFGTPILGTLTINYISNTPIVIQAGNDSKIYDGTALKATQYYYTDGVLADGDVLQVVLNGSIANVGKADATVVSYKVIRNTTDVTDGYVFGEHLPGCLEITKRSVVLISASGTKKYDGTELKNDTVTVSGDGFIQGEGFAVSVTGTQTQVGQSKNTFTYSLTPETDGNNYSITKEEGILEVTLISETPIAIRVEDQTRKYNGSPLVATYIYTGNLANGDSLDVSVEGEITNVGSVATAAHYRVLRGDIDVTAGYLFEQPVCGTLTVTPRIIEVSSRSVTKVYDGSPLSSSLVSVTGDGFVIGERIAFSAEVSLTEPGSVSNTILCDVSDCTNPDNYEIQISEGTLTILAKQIDANIEGFILESNAGLEPGVTLSVEENVDVTANLEEGLEIKAVYDLTLKKDGVAIQPDSSVTITIPIPQKLQGIKNLFVCYIDGDGNAKELNTERNGNTLTFTTNHFSLYAIVADESNSPLSGLSTDYLETIILIESIALVAVLVISVVIIIVIKKKARNGYYS